MIDEIIDAIKSCYENDEDTQVECLLWLSNHINDGKSVGICLYTIEEMGRCTNCGGELATQQIKQVHWELDEHPTEILCEKYCPNCDL